MTLVLGFRSLKATFICGDSAVTSSGDNMAPDSHSLITPTSSFDELVVDESTRKVREMACKTMQINDQIIAGLAGNAFCGLAVLDRFRELMNGVDITVETVTKTLRKSAYDFIPGNFHLASFLIGFTTSDGPHLIRYKNDEFEIDSSITAIGTYTSSQLQRLKSFTGTLLFQDGNTSMPYMEDEDKCAYITTSLQYLTLSDKTFPLGVGGAFFAIYVKDNKVRRPADVLYGLLNSNNFEIERYVLVKEKENVLAVSSMGMKSSKNGLMKLFADPMVYDGEPGLKKLTPIGVTLNQGIFYDTFMHAAFVLPQRGFVIVKRKPNNSKSHYVKYVRMKNGKGLAAGTSIAFPEIFSDTAFIHLFFFHDQDYPITAGDPRDSHKRINVV